MTLSSRVRHITDWIPEKICLQKLGTVVFDSASDLYSLDTTILPTSVSLVHFRCLVTVCIFDYLLLSVKNFSCSNKHDFYCFLSRDVIERHSISHKPTHLSGPVKRSPPYSSYQHRDAPPPKKHKISSSSRDISLSEAGKYGTLNDYAFFDKVIIKFLISI